MISEKPADSNKGLTNNEPALAEGSGLDVRALAISIFFPIWYLALALVAEVRAVGTPYFVTEYMITYSGGFVRRGLLGQAFLSLGDLIGFPAYRLIFFARFALALVGSFVVARLVYKNRQVLGYWGMAIILSSPMIGLFLWLGLGPVDLLFILIPLWHLWIARQSRDNYVLRATLLFSTLGVAVCLSHEAFVFLCLPINAAISWRQIGEHKVLTLLKIYGLVLIAFAVSCSFHGTGQQVIAIKDSWQSRGVTLSRLNATEYLGSSAKVQIEQTLHLIRPLSIGVWASIGAACIWPLIYLKRYSLRDQAAQQWFEGRVWIYLGVPLICTLPLYPIGNDWHRWLAIPFATAILCFLADGLPHSAVSPPLIKRPLVLSMILIELVVLPISLYFAPISGLVGPLSHTIYLIVHGTRRG